jgi:hypothetical protein
VIACLTPDHEQTKDNSIVSFSSTACKKISAGATFNCFATFFLAFSIAVFTSLPQVWSDEGLPIDSASQESLH